MNALQRALWSAMCSFCMVAPCIAAPFSDAFSGGALDPRWIVQTPNPDTSVSLDGRGHLVIVASPLNGGSDLWPASNFNAPLILQPVLPSDDWIVQTQVSVQMQNFFQSAGITLTTQLGPYDSLAQTIRIMEFQYYAPQGLQICFYDSTCSLVPGSKDLWMKVKKKGTQYTAYYSLDGKQWTLLQKTSVLADIRYMGLVAMRQPWDNNLNVYTTAAFNSFKVKSLTN